MYDLNLIFKYLKFNRRNSSNIYVTDTRVLTLCIVFIVYSSLYLGNTSCRV